MTFSGMRLTFAWVANIEMSLMRGVRVFSQRSKTYLAMGVIAVV